MSKILSLEIFFLKITIGGAGGQGRPRASRSWLPHGAAPAAPKKNTLRVILGCRINCYSFFYFEGNVDVLIKFLIFY